MFTIGPSRIPTLCRAATESDVASDSGTYDVDDDHDDSVAVVEEARRQIDKVFGVLSNVPSATSVTSNAPAADTRVLLPPGAVL